MLDSVNRRLRPLWRSVASAHHRAEAWSVGAASCRRGYVATIHPGRDFYVSLADHVEWSSAHTAWSRVETELGMQTIERIVSMPFRETHHPQHGTAMRMLEAPVPLALVLGACPDG